MVMVPGPVQLWLNLALKPHEDRETKEAFDFLNGHRVPGRIPLPQRAAISSIRIGLKNNLLKKDVGKKKLEVVEDITISGHYMLWATTVHEFWHSSFLFGHNPLLHGQPVRLCPNITSFIPLWTLHLLLNLAELNICLQTLCRGGEGL